MTVTRAAAEWHRRFRNEFEASMDQIALTAMLPVESLAKEIVYLGHEQGHLNRQSGNLSKSITTEVDVSAANSPEGKVVVVVGTNMVYAPTHEFGDDRVAWGKVMVHIPPRPFLQPAFKTVSNSGIIQKQIRDGFEQIVRKVNR